MNKQPSLTKENEAAQSKQADMTNYVSGEKPQRAMDEQPVKPQKPMSIDEYTKALRKEAEVAKLRATIAKSMFEENMAMFQLNQLRSGNIGQARPPQEQPEESLSEEPIVD